MRRTSLFFSVLTCYAWLVAPAFAQPFQILIQEEDTLLSVANGASVGVSSSDVGKPITVTISLIYRGNSSASISQAPTLTGSSTFAIVQSPSVPATLNPGGTFSFDVRYTPTTSNNVNALVGVTYLEAPPPGSPSNTFSSNGFIALNLIGQAPEFLVAYFLPSNGNVITLPQNSTLTFPPTPVNTTTSATVSVFNRGSGAGLIRSIAVTGAAFQTTGVSLTPASVASGQEFRFNILYSPTKLETSAGLLTVTFEDRVLTINLEGSSAHSNLGYTVLGPQGSTTVTPNQTITLPDTQLGQSSSVSIQVQNTGNINATIGSINSTGAGFQLANLPGLPKTLAPGESTIFTVGFVPTQAGQATGRLLIGNDTFDLVANVAGVSLIYSYTSGSSTITLPTTSGSIFFSPIAIGQTVKTTVAVLNSGTSPFTFSNIGIVDSKSPFTLADLPALPVILSPGSSMKFTVAFKPTSAGFATGTLRLDAQTFDLSGSGATPPALPSFSFTGTSGAVAPLQQPTIGLTLAAPYSLPLIGMLTLSLNAVAFGDDPSIQFSTGGRTVSFTIPANTTQAIFPNNSQQIRLQSGTVAGTISVKPTFAIGNLDITPDSAPSLQLTVPTAAPVLFDLLVASTSSSSLALLITGVTTPRSLTKLDFDFTIASGFHASTTHYSLDVSAAALSWFGSVQAEPFGGQFSITIPFALQTTDGNVVALNGIQSVSVTASNTSGASNAVTVALR